MFAPARRRGTEFLDDPNVDPDIRRRSIDDVRLSNRVLGGRRAALLALRAAARGVGPSYVLLDVGTGFADIPARACSEAKRSGTNVTTVGVDAASSLLVAAGPRLTHAVCANALTLPFRDRSVDVVLCSQVLHHFDQAHVEELLREINRVARHAVVVSDLRRSWFAAIGFWLVSFPLRFHRVTRHDGVVSVLRGFTATELRTLVERACGTTPVVHGRLGFRLTASWQPRISS